MLQVSAHGVLDREERSHVLRRGAAARLPAISIQQVSEPRAVIAVHNVVTKLRRKPVRIDAAQDRATVRRRLHDGLHIRPGGPRLVVRLPLGAEGDDPLDLRQGFFEVGNPAEFPVMAKVGRQELIYGDERLIGAFDWNNFSRTFDAVKLRYQKDPQKFWVDAFVATSVRGVEGYVASGIPPDRIRLIYNGIDRTRYDPDRVRGDRVRIGIRAPSSVPVHRKEVFLAIQRENVEAARAAAFVSFPHPWPVSSRPPAPSLRASSPSDVAVSRGAEVMRMRFPWVEP